MKIDMLSFWERYIDIDLGVGIIKPPIKDYTRDIGHQKIAVHTIRDTITEIPERRQYITSNFVQKTICFPMHYYHDTYHIYPLQKDVVRVVHTGNITVPANTTMEIISHYTEGYIEKVFFSSSTDRMRWYVTYDDNTVELLSINEWKDEGFLFMGDNDGYWISTYVYPPRFNQMLNLYKYIRQYIRIKAYNGSAISQTVNWVKFRVYRYIK